ncbi:hypothetical protein [Bradyrhizobium sp. USDA 3650]
MKCAIVTLLALTSLQAARGEFKAVFFSVILALGAHFGPKMKKS